MSQPLQSLAEVSPLLSPMRSPANYSVSPLRRSSNPLPLDMTPKARRGGPPSPHGHCTPTYNASPSPLRRNSPLRPLETSQSRGFLPNLLRLSTTPTTSVPRAIWPLSTTEESGEQHRLSVASPSCGDTVSPASIVLFSSPLGN